MTNPLDDWRAEEERALAARRQAGLLRRLRLPQGIDLVSNDFLGLASHAHLIEAMRAALPGLGVGAGGSRLLRGHDRAFERIEVRLAAFCDTEAALLFSTGYAANQGLLQTLVGPDDLVLSDERNHASIIDGIRLSRARKVVYSQKDLGPVELLRFAREVARLRHVGAEPPMAPPPPPLGLALPSSE